MKLFKIIYVVIFYALIGGNCAAQISPGELSSFHSHLEGVSNCTQCHILGEKVSNDKCLNCHTELKERTSQNKGYHSSIEVKGKECATCHSDHHGLSFQIIKMDANKFNHTLTGFPLAGAHVKKKCGDCHSPKKISDSKIKNKKFTFLGLKESCINCHDDYHKKTLSENCANCHDANAFKPASKFNHTNAKFKLSGKHVTVECIKCHKVEIKEGKKLQEFTGLQYGNCNGCHADVHKNQFGQNCTQCHSEESFHIIKQANNFDHNKTKFKLEGKHQGVECKLCHKGKYTTPIKHEKCTDCHKDFHNGQFAKNGLSPDCSVCHNHSGFVNFLYTREQHNNDNKYKLEGKHMNVECKLCHKVKYTTPLKHEKCIDCHQDYHKSEFTKNGISPDCSSCHDLAGFKNFSYTLEQHNTSIFVLQGAHIATPCSDCHKKTVKWTFREIGKRCVDCHTNIHKDLINKKYYPENNCKSCHDENRWTEINFDHSQTNFKLLGVHLSQPCRKCHFKEKTDDIKQQKFTNLSVECNTCHADIHFKQFEKNAVTDCSNCHEFDNWKASKFNHDNTAFKLDAKHENVPCKKCHKPTAENQNSYIKYKIKTTCESCH